MKRRFHRHDFPVVSVNSLHRYRQFHELACLVNGCCGDDFRQGADPRLHKSAETRLVAVAKVRRDNDFDRLPHGLRTRVTEQFFGFPAPAADLAGRVYRESRGHRYPAFRVDKELVCGCFGFA
jgi:hypothetical protein